MKKLLISILAALALPVLGADYVRLGAIDSTAPSDAATPTNWVADTVMPAARVWMGYGNYSGKMYSVGGISGGIGLTSVYAFDGAAWSTLAVLPKGLTENSVGTLGAYMYSCGGQDGSGTAYTNVYRFDGAAWTEVAGLPGTRRVGAVATLNNSMYYMGGADGSGQYTNVWKFDGSSWTEVAGLPSSRKGLFAATLNGYIYAGGGTVGPSLQTNVWKFDGATWTEVAGLPEPVGQGVGAAFNGKIYVIAGTSMLGAELFVFDGTSWTTNFQPAAILGGMGIGSVGTNLYFFGGGFPVSTQNQRAIMSLSALPAQTWRGADGTLGIQVYKDKILPASSNIVDIGSASMPFRHGYFGTASLYVGTQAVSQTAVQNWNQSTGTVATLPTNNWNAAYGWGNHASGGYTKADGSVTWTGAQNAGNTIITNLGGFWIGGVLVTNIDTQSVVSAESAIATDSNRITVLENRSNDWNTATTYNNAANQTNVLLSFTFTFQDPTNGLVYWNANPYATRACTLVSAFVKSHGMTGTVDLLRQHRSSAWYTYTSLTNGVALNTTGTEQTAFYGPTAITNGVRLGVMFNNLSAFAWTNMATVDITVRYP